MPTVQQLTIGNDIVDLATDEPPLHARYLERAFTTNERSRIKNDSASLWAHWAAKEAAYKAIKRIQPDYHFSPISIAVDTIAGTITADSIVLAIEVNQSPEFVHIRCGTDATLAASKEWIAEISPRENPSQQLRTLAIEKISAEIQIAPARLSIAADTLSGAPLVQCDGDTLPHLVSFSHHGRFVACAFLAQ